MFYIGYPFGTFGSIRRWNKTAAECYMRGCVCEGCPIYELYFKPNKARCCMKYAVREMVRKFGIPEALKKALKRRQELMMIEENNNER